MVKNNKGFMLAEVVIVSTVIVTTLVALYVSVNRLYMLYNERSNYYNIDGIYLIEEMMDYLFKGNRLNDILSASDSNIKTDDYVFLIKDSTCNDINGVNLSGLDNDGDGIKDSNLLCNTLVSLYDIKNFVIVRYDNMSAIIDVGINNTFVDYINYLNKYYSDDSSIKYLILVEYGNSDNLYYSNLRLR